MIHASHDAPVSTVTSRRPGEAVERAARGHGEQHHRAVELRAHQVVDHRATRTAHDARLVAGSRVEGERQAEVLRGCPERVVRGVVVGRCGTFAGRNSARKPCSAATLRVVDRAVDVEHRDGGGGTGSAGRRTPRPPSCCTRGRAGAGTRRPRTRSTPGARTSGRSPRRRRRRAPGRADDRRRRTSPTMATSRSEAGIRRRGRMFSTINERHSPMVSMRGTRSRNVRVDAARRTTRSVRSRASRSR